MATMTNPWGSAFAVAWHWLVDLPLPKSRLLAEREFGEEHGHLVLAAFPVVGAVLGVAAWSLVWVLDRFLTPSAVAAVAAPIIVVGLEWLVQGRNFATLATVCAVLGRKREPNGESAATPALPPLQSPMGMIMFMGMFMLRVLAMAVLIRWGLASWLIVTFALAAQVHGRLATLPDLHRSQALLPAVPELAAEYSWTAAFVVTLVAGLSYFPAVFLAWLVAWGCARYAAQFCERRFGGITEELAGAAACAAEFVLLLAGMLLLVRD